MTAKNLLSLLYDRDGPKLSVLDQLLIPDKKEYIEIPNVEAAWAVIRSMQIRGAPLIAMVACLGLSVDLNANQKTISEMDALDANDSDVIMAYIEKKMEYLATSRPTAVNLFNALKELKDALLKVKDDVSSDEPPTTARDRMCTTVATHAEYMLRRDVSDNEAIGRFGADEILSRLDDPDANVRMMTICNTGSLATAGFGTALGVARALQKRNRLASITALETRPYNQGSRLTAFEIVQENMPGGTLICDSAAATLMKTKGVDAVVVGADRVCANGDTANKVGTYSLAIAAASHGVPFFVASPFTTLDTSLKSGDDVEIEERPAKELLQSSRAPSSIGVWNPGFDVTPARFISGIITEKGVIEQDEDGTIDVAAFVEKFKDKPTAKPRLLRRLSSMIIPIDYTEQSVYTLPIYLSRTAPAVLRILEATSSADIECTEMGDGNLDGVFLVRNTHNDKKAVVKQALPYVRRLTEPTPMSPDRAWHEYKALAAFKEVCPDFIPEVYFFSKANALLVMEFIPPPTMTLRKGMLRGNKYSTVASDMGRFCAQSLFRTSGFKLKETDLRNEVEFWSSNAEMCGLTERAVFTEPYTSSPNNQWTSPQLDSDKEAIENDTELKLAVLKLKTKFVTQSQALLHGDLNASSVLCAPEAGRTHVIDTKFAFYGSMGYDTGVFVANLLLAQLAQHDNPDFGDWILQQVLVFYKTFESEFLQLWNDETEHIGMCYSRDMIEDDAVMKSCQDEFMTELLRDTLGFSGVTIIRHVVGNLNVGGLEGIVDQDVRAKCEQRALEMGKTLIKMAPNVKSVEEAFDLIQAK